jgi:hypothetical protein
MKREHDMADTRDNLDPIRQRALSAFEAAVKRTATEAEIQTIAEKNIRRGSSMFCVMNMPPIYTVALSIQGPEYKTAGKYTATGGGLFDDGETDPRLVALRELTQEVVDDQGDPILGDIDPANMVALYENIDVSMLLPNAPHPEWDIVIAETFYAIMNPAQTQRLTAHGERLSNDFTYAEAAFNHTQSPVSGKNEIGGMVIASLASAVHRHTLASMQHTHEREGLIVLGQKLLLQ